MLRIDQTARGFYVLIRRPFRFYELRTPEWVRAVAAEVCPHAEVSAGRLTPGSPFVLHSIFLPRASVPFGHQEAEEFATRIQIRVEGQ